MGVFDWLFGKGKSEEQVKREEKKQREGRAMETGRKSETESLVAKAMGENKKYIKIKMIVEPYDENEVGSICGILKQLGYEVDASEQEYGNGVIRWKGKLKKER